MSRLKQAELSEVIHKVIWAALPKQAEFLACSDFEVLYGGAAGGGKSDAMLIDATGASYNGLTYRHFRAVIFRKTMPDLQPLIDRAQELYPLLCPGIKYNKNDHTFTAPSGAKILFAYLATDDDRLKYRGYAWNYVGFEELTLWATPTCFLYMHSRCRSTDPFLRNHCYIRATTNPDGPGQLWVMRHWAIGEEGDATLQTVEVEYEVEQADGEFAMEMRKVRRRFIPAKLKDNKHLRGTGYRERLMAMSPEDRAALLDGKWTGNKVHGAYYVKQMSEARQEGRICNVPHLRGQPVNTFWDLGFNDTTAIWFHQYAGLANRFLHCFENSGEAIEYYAQYLQTMSVKRGYIYGTHYLPHDAESKQLQTGKSLLDMARKAMPGAKFVVVPRVEDILIGINQTRQGFPTCWFDKDGCPEGLAALDAYRKKWDPKQEVFMETPIHDRFSNYADAFRQWAQGFNAPRIARDANSDEPQRRARGAGWKTA